MFFSLCFSLEISVAISPELFSFFLFFFLSLYLNLSLFMFLFGNSLCFYIWVCLLVYLFFVFLYVSLLLCISLWFSRHSSWSSPTYWSSEHGSFARCFGEMLGLTVQLNKHVDKKDIFPGGKGFSVCSSAVRRYAVFIHELLDYSLEISTSLT